MLHAARKTSHEIRLTMPTGGRAWNDGVHNNFVPMFAAEEFPEVKCAEVHASLRHWNDLCNHGTKENSCGKSGCVRNRKAV